MRADFFLIESDERFWVSALAKSIEKKNPKSTSSAYAHERIVFGAPLDQNGFKPAMNTEGESVKPLDF